MLPVLLAIDMLNDYFRQGRLAEQRVDLVHSINEVVALFRHRQWPIIWVRQEFAPDLSDAFLVMREHGIAVTIKGTEGCHLDFARKSTHRQSVDPRILARSWHERQRGRLLEIARRDQRAFYSIPFSGRGQFEVWTDSGTNPQDLAEHLTHFYNGGTELYGPLVAALEAVQTVNDELQRAETRWPVW